MTDMLKDLPGEHHVKPACGKWDIYSIIAYKLTVITCSASHLGTVCYVESYPIRVRKFGAQMIKGAAIARAKIQKSQSCILAGNSTYVIECIDLPCVIIWYCAVDYSL